MKKLNAAGVIIALVIFFALGLMGSIATFAQTTPSLGAAATYGVLAGTYSNSSVSTTITGDVGYTTGPATVPAGTHTHYGSGVPYSTAMTDAANALATGLAPQACTFTFSGTVNLSTDTTHSSTTGTYAPGVYCSTGAMDVGGPVTLSGAGTYIFRADGTLTSDNGSIITLVGASPSDIFWTATAATTLGANTIFFGTDIDNANAITVGDNTTWTGRAISLGAGSVTTGNGDAISVPSVPPPPSPATLNVIKVVVNGNGSTATPANFMMHVENGGSDVSGSPAPGAAAPGTAYSLAAGTYTVSENTSSSYNEIIGGDCNASGTITLAAGQAATCTITNTNNTVPPPPSPATLNVIKVVVNGNGSMATPANFMMHVENGGSDVSGSPAPGAAAPGTAYSLAAGTYTVSENTSSSYNEIIGGDCNASGTITLAAGDNKICTIINTNIPPPAPLVAAPSTSMPGSVYGNNTSGGMIVPVIGILDVPTPLALPAGSGSVTYNYTVWNVGGQQALDDVSVADNACNPVVYVSGDANGNGKLDPGEHWKYNCAATLATTTTNTAVATGYSADPYHQAAFATAIATVVVGAPVTPPLINIVKVPSRLTPFPYGGGTVTYTYTVTNPGVVPIHNVVVTDNKCSPVSYVSGDANSNRLLDPGETWTYTCKTNISVSTRNIATAEGTANGFTALDYAFATVLVSAPGLPNTGFPPIGESIPRDVIVLVVILGLASALNRYGEGS